MQKYLESVINELSVSSSSCLSFLKENDLEKAREKYFNSGYSEVVDEILGNERIPPYMKEKLFKNKALFSILNNDWKCSFENLTAYLKTCALDPWAYYLLGLNIMEIHQNLKHSDKYKIGDELPYLTTAFEIFCKCLGCIFICEDMSKSIDEAIEHSIEKISEKNPGDMRNSINSENQLSHQEAVILRKKCLGWLIYVTYHLKYYSKCLFYIKSLIKFPNIGSLLSFTLMNYRTLCLISMREKEFPRIVDSIQWQSNPSEDEKLIDYACKVNRYELPKNRKEAMAIIMYQNIIGNCIIENYEEALETYKTTYILKHLPKNMLIDLKFVIDCIRKLSD